MSEQARKVKHEAIPQWAQGLFYNKGLFKEALVYYDDEALYFEVRGQDSGIVRFSLANFREDPFHAVSILENGCGRRLGPA